MIWRGRQDRQSLQHQLTVIGATIYLNMEEHVCKSLAFGKFNFMIFIGMKLLSECRLIFCNQAECYITMNN